MNGRRLIDALRQSQTPAPAWAACSLCTGPRMVGNCVPGYCTCTCHHAQPPPAVPQMPAGTLGYAVARCDPYGLTVLTHASLMPADEARREADAQRQADGRGYSWSVVEVRRA